jgi:hypothetical protein
MSTCGAAVPEFDDAEIFAAFESARVYYSQHRRSNDVRGLVGPYFSHLPEIEYLRADLCRPELLIEIEGVARIGAERNPVKLRIVHHEILRESYVADQHAAFAGKR